MESVRYRRWGLWGILFALLPALLAIWFTPWFVTQDGPAHLYNAQIITQSGDPSSPFASFYRVNWKPLPNWVGHLSLAGLLRVVPPWVADRLMTTLTLAGFAASIVWLRWRVVGWRGLPMATVLAVLLSLNVSWLLGFTSFTVGACLFPITLGIWWQGRDRLGPGYVAVLWGLTLLGYFCHLVSLGLTVVGLAVLCLFAPGERRLARAGWTALGLLPLAPLGLIYLRLTREGGAMRPIWNHLSNPLSPRSWFSQMNWADPISLASKVVLPFREGSSPAFALAAPAIALLVALGLEGVAMLRTRRLPRTEPSAFPDRRGWGILAALLLLGGTASPDTLGESHGNYLPQRIVLFGLVALVAVLDLEAKSKVGRAAAVALVWALAVQSVFLWEYAATSNRNVGALMQARSTLGTNQRVATLLMGIPSRFRANPILHADNLLGVDTGNVIWSNYETRHYYFPVQFKDDVDRPDAKTLEDVSLDSDPDPTKRTALWTRELEAHHQSIDKILAWGKDDALDPITARWFTPIYTAGKVRVFQHR